MLCRKPSKDKRIIQQFFHYSDITPIMIQEKFVLTQLGLITMIKLPKQCGESLKCQTSFKKISFYSEVASLSMALSK